MRTWVDIDLMSVIDEKFANLATTDVKLEVVWVFHPFSVKDYVQWLDG